MAHKHLPYYLPEIKIITLLRRGKMKKLISCILLLSMLFAAAACSGDSSADETAAADTTAADQAETTTVSETLYVEDELPDDLSFDGADVKIITRLIDAPLQELNAAEQNGDIVNDAIYERNLEVEQRLDVKLVLTEIPGGSVERHDWTAYIGKTVQAGSGDFDMLSGYSRSVTACSTAGYIMDLSDVEYLDFDKPWWPENIISDLSTGGKVFFCSGDISPMLINALMCIYFNHNLIESYSLENPYELVNDGTWTIDKMMKMTDGIYTDLNGDGVRSFEDRLGFCGYSVWSDSFFYAAGLHITEQGSDGMQYISDTFGGEKTHKVVETLNAYFKTQNAYLGHGAEVMPQSQMNFAQGNSVFTVHQLSYVMTHLRDMEDAYGILPVPKYDEAQDSYYTTVDYDMNLYAIPKDATNVEMTGAVLECLASESYRTVSPALFEVALKVKYSHDVESAAMYDILRSTVSFDFGRLYNTDFGGLTYSLFRNAMIADTVNWSSIYASNETKLKTTLETVTAKLLEN